MNKLREHLVQLQAESSKRFMLAYAFNQHEQTEQAIRWYQDALAIHMYAEQVAHVVSEHRAHNAANEQLYMVPVSP